jgi:endonuclease YncB( thermonuclease family)
MPPEPQPPEPTPEPPPVRDEPPPVPEKVLIDGLDVIISHVTDGDTIYVVKKPGGWASRIRLKGLNAPECHKVRNGSFQSCDKDDDYFGLGAYEIAKKLANGDFRKAKLACIEKQGECEKDSFGRYLGYIVLPDGRDLGNEIIAAGGGWSFTRYTATKLKQYCGTEADAIKAKKGMWTQGRPYVKSRMSGATKSWYYASKNGHDSVCGNKLGESFSKRAGE